MLQDAEGDGTGVIMDEATATAVPGGGEPDDIHLMVQEPLHGFIGNADGAVTINGAEGV
jgi:hypothetical protein